jgi:hypothetical protein
MHRMKTFRSDGQDYTPPNCSSSERVSALRAGLRRSTSRC